MFHITIYGHIFNLDMPILSLGERPKKNDPVMDNEDAQSIQVILEQISPLLTLGDPFENYYLPQKYIKVSSVHCGVICKNLTFVRGLEWIMKLTA